MKGFAGFGVQTFKGNDKRMQHSDRKSFPENSREFLKKKVRFVNRTNKGIRKEDNLNCGYPPGSNDKNVHGLQGAAAGLSKLSGDVSYKWCCTSS
jgi:hypothetical protein